ncbi:MAG TPA: TIGR02300 family protein [Magnetospirillum sp.]|nr:TIGR02300 family protein [Magnetospirillum sp.]
MAKPEWGQKRTCNSCGCRFYDMSRSPITCPKCGGTVEADMPFKVRRGSAAAQAEAKAAVPVLANDAEVEADDLVTAEDEDAIDGEEESADEDESGLIEDASDLGEDDDDMAEVMEHLDEEIEDEV